MVVSDNEAMPFLSKVLARSRLWIVSKLVPELTLELDLRGHSPTIFLARPKAGDPIGFLVASVSAALRNQTYLPAIATALIIPDALGRISAPKLGSMARTAQWFDSYVGDKQNLDGYALYAMRCAVLHQSSLAPDDQAKAWSKSMYAGKVMQFVLLADPLARMTMLLADKLVIDAPSLCRSILQGVEQWRKAATTAELTEANDLLADTAVLRSPNLNIAGLYAIASGTLR